MKRFYTAATVAPSDDGYAVRLDGKPVNTPSRKPLAVPTRALALALAKEWNVQSDEIDLRTMGLTGLANTAIDRVAHDRPTFIDGLAAYGESDLLCYRAETPAELAAEQARQWDPIMAWFERNHAARLKVTQGIVHIAQPPETLRTLRAALEGLGDFRLAAFQPLVTIGGSLVTALTLGAEAISSDEAWAAVTLDEDWQQRHWGADDDAVRALGLKRGEWDRAVEFLALLG